MAWIGWSIDGDVNNDIDNTQIRYVIIHYIVCCLSNWTFVQIGHSTSKPTSVRKPRPLLTCDFIYFFSVFGITIQKAINDWTYVRWSEEMWLKMTKERAKTVEIDRENRQNRTRMKGIGECGRNEHWFCAVATTYALTVCWIWMWRL